MNSNSSTGNKYLNLYSISYSQNDDMDAVFDAPEPNSNKWEKEQSFVHNSNEYSISHPALSPDGKTLYFVSDMPGSHGGSDIYVCYKKDESWSIPKNLGPEINTVGDEKFPFVHKKGAIYFASDGHPGYGGLDVFVAHKNGQNWNVCNLKVPINSPRDDFGLILDEVKSTGFLCSNRKGGNGADDVYYVAKNLNFKCVSVYQDYCVVLTAEEDTNMPPAIFEWIFGIEENKKGIQVEHCYPGPGTYYVQLIVKAKETGEIIYQEKQIKIEISEDKNSKPKIDLIAEKRIKLRKSVKFDASGLVEGCNIYKYVWLMGDGNILNGKSITHRYDEVGEYKVSLKMTGEGLACGQSCDTCIYKLISVYEDAMEINVEAIDTNIWIKGKVTDKHSSMPISGLMLILESQDFVDIRETNEEGFYFFIAEPNTVYNLSTSSTDYFDISEKLSTVMMESSSINNNIELEKIELDKAITIDNLYYGVGDFRINREAAKELDNLIDLLKANPKISIEISSHTDSNNSKEYNQILSEKRAKTVVNYIVSKGINTNRITGKGYGESKLLNHCKDGIKCTEEEHSKNRRTEFKVIGLN